MNRSPAAPPFPGAAASINRLQGRYGLASLGGFTITLFEWEVEPRTDFVDGTGHGDIWDVPVPLKYMWTARLRSRYHSGDATALHAAYSGQITGSPPPDITPVLFSGYASSNTASPVFTGQGFLVRVHWGSALGSMVEQEIEVRGTGIPATIP